MTTNHVFDYSMLWEWEEVADLGRDNPQDGAVGSLGPTEPCCIAYVPIVLNRFSKCLSRGEKMILHKHKHFRVKVLKVVKDQVVALGEEGPVLGIGITTRL